MTVRLTMTTDKAGVIRVVDELSGHGLQFYERAAIDGFLADTGGNKYEQALREALRATTAADQTTLTRQDFTFTPAKAETTWAL